MSLERKIEKFNIFHVFGDLVVLITIFSVVFFACKTIYEQGGANLEGIQPINQTMFLNSIGFSIFVFEGIPVVLPLMDVTEKPE